jgi:hypothetical protein
MHAREPVEPWIVGRPDAARHGDARHAIAEQCSAGQCVRTAARDAVDGKGVEPERVRDRRHVGRGRRHVTPGSPRRPAIAGPVEADQTDVAAPAVRGSAGAVEATARRAVVRDHRESA